MHFEHLNDHFPILKMVVQRRNTKGVAVWLSDPSFSVQHHEHGLGGSASAWTHGNRVWDAVYASGESTDDEVGTPRIRKPAWVDDVVDSGADRNGIVVTVVPHVAKQVADRIVRRLPATRYDPDGRPVCFPPRLVVSREDHHLAVGNVLECLRFLFQMRLRRHVSADADLVATAFLRPGTDIMLEL